MRLEAQPLGPAATGGETGARLDHRPSLFGSAAPACRVRPQATGAEGRGAPLLDPAPLLRALYERFPRRPIKAGRGVPVFETRRSFPPFGNSKSRSNKGAMRAVLQFGRRDMPLLVCATD